MPIVICYLLPNHNWIHQWTNSSIYCSW